MVKKTHLNPFFAVMTLVSTVSLYFIDTVKGKKCCLKYPIKAAIISRWEKSQFKASPGFFISCTAESQAAVLVNTIQLGAFEICKATGGKRPKASHCEKFLWLPLVGRL